MKLRVNPVLVSPALMAFHVRSYTEAGREYLVTLDMESGAVECDCPHFQFRLAKGSPLISSESERLCKHVRAIKRSARARLGRTPAARDR